MQRRNTMTALLFLAALAAGFGMVLSSFLGGEGHLEALVKGLRQGPAGAAALLEGGEAAVNQDLDRDHLFIQLYGGVQRLSGRRLIQDVSAGSDVARLDDGSLNFVSLPASPAGEAVDANAAQTAALKGYLDGLGIPYLYVQAPQKIQRGTDPLPTGVDDYGNANADRFLGALETAGVDSLDLRDVFDATEDYSAWFFQTDHHWRPEGAFLAWQAVAGVLASDYGWAIDPALTDEGSYEKIGYQDFFLGSQGKRVGSLYAGADDFTRYSPKFDTSLTYAVAGGAVREGTFDTSVLFPERLEERDWFGGNPYTFYSGGDYGFARMTNHNNPDGPKILLIRDSFACAFAPFLALGCSELITVDLRYLDQGTLPDILAREQPDLVMTLYTAGTTALPELFRFF